MGLDAHRVWRVRGLHALSVEQKPDAANVLPLAIAECVHELLELRRPLDLKEDLVVVVRDLDVQVLSSARILRLLHVVGRAVVGHGSKWCYESWRAGGWVSEGWWTVGRRLVTVSGRGRR